MPFADWIPHLATDLEIAAKHIDNGDDVHIIQCSGDLASCEPNPNHFPIRCHLCKSKRNKGLDLIKLPDENRHELALNKFDQSLEIPDFSTIQDLKDFQINNVDIGMAVISTLISMVREPYPDIKYYKHFISKNLPMSLAVYNAIEYYLKEIKPDIFYLFNGRYASLRPALRAAQKLGVKTYVHERAGVLQRYSLTEDTYPHDIEYYKSQIEQHWNDERPITEKEKLAMQWFEERRGGKDQSWHSFTKSQITGNLPKSFDPTKRNIVIYISSQDEFESIVGWHNPLYSDQVDAINAIINSEIDQNIRFYIRIHPNLKGLKNTQTRKLSTLKAPKLVVIHADDKIDSYELMDACEKVISFGSTVGIESVFWGKPSILVGRSFYEDVGGCYIPDEHYKLIELINNSDLDLKPIVGALKYGYMQAVRGHGYKYYSPESIRSGKFMGKYLGNPITTYIKGKILSIDILSNFIFNSVYFIRKLTWKIR